MDVITVLLTGVVIFAASIMEALTGFGSGIIALPFLAVLIGIKTAVPMIMVISVVFTSYMLALNFKKVAWKEYFTIIGFVALGLPVGIYIFSAFDEKNLKLFLGLFIIVFSLRALIKIKFPHQPANLRAYGIFQRIMLFMGGIVQGAFATGGPLIVIYSADKIKEKSSFRATMCVVWLTLNTILLTKNFIVGGIMTKHVFVLVAGAFPFFVAGSLIGLKLHKKVSLRVFTLLINIVLMAAGITTTVLTLI
jgi:uncharacterized protein